MNGIDRFASAAQTLEESQPPRFTSTIAAVGLWREMAGDLAENVDW